MSDPLRLGGMALRNGLLVHGPSMWAAAVRDSRGEIVCASGPKPRLRVADGVPGLRGVLRMGEAMAVIPLVKRALPQARLPFEDVRVAGAALGVLAAGTVLRRRGLAGEAGAAVLSLAPAMLALRGGELAQYHGAEHKAIGAYERGEDAAQAPKEHDRCGSHLVAPLLAANLAGVAMLRQAVERPGPLAGAAVGIGSLAAAVEVFAWSERNAQSPVARALQAPGDALQRALGTREPTEAQLDVARAALAEILRVEEADS